MLRIVYQGNFLKDGLEQLGYTIYPISFARDRDIDEQVEEICHDPDFVLIQLWGDTNIPLHLSKSRHRLVAHCIDTPINTYWMSSLVSVFDDVFVDQKSSVTTMAKEGVRSIWLPLAVSDSCFRHTMSKKYDISFVGHFSRDRMKRKNIVEMLKKYFNVNIVEGVDVHTMIDIFAQSKIVLNENLFSGLTLRVLQGLASGSLVFTESYGDGVNDFFQDGVHLVTYTPTNLIEKTAFLLDHSDQCSKIAATGQEACLKKHTSLCRAKELIACLHSGTARNQRQDQHSRVLAESRAMLRFTGRYGGFFLPIAQDLQSLLSERNQIADEAACLLGDLKAWQKKYNEAYQLWISAVKTMPFQAGIRLTLLFLHQEDFLGASQILAHITGSPLPQKPLAPETILLRLAEACFKQGRIFDLGYLKKNDLFPDTALNLAFMAWKISPSIQVLDMIIRCAETCSILGEILPYILKAIDLGIASDVHIRRAAAIAASLYDLDLTQKILELC